MKTSLIGMAALLLCPALSSCHHKDLIYESDLLPEIKVVFDWRNAPEANPESMALVLYDATTGKPMHFMFDNRNGGIIKVPYGQYNGLCINSDINDWAYISHDDDIDDFEVSTADATELAAFDIPASQLPAARDGESERMAETPSMLWSNRQDSIVLKAAVQSQTITMYPDEAICHYTVDVTDVENIEYVEGSNVDATISGMSGSYMHGRNKPSDTHVTMPFVLSVSGADTLHSEFLTFGESHDSAYSHKLTVYLYLKDGTRWYNTYDVTDQVSQAPDPRHVHIVVSGLNIPKPMLSGGGFEPDVQDWNDVTVDINM